MKSNEYGMVVPPAELNTGEGYYRHQKAVHASLLNYLILFGAIVMLCGVFAGPLYGMWWPHAPLLLLGGGVVLAGGIALARRSLKSSSVDDRSPILR